MSNKEKLANKLRDLLKNPKLVKSVDFLKKHKKKVIISAIAIAVIASIGIAVAVKKNGGNKNAEQTALSVVTRGDVQLTITGSAAVEPVERYEIIPLVNGEIIEAPYEVGDVVNEGDVLYTFDMADAQLSMQKQQNSMIKSEMSWESAQKDYDKLNVTAPCDGIISGMNVSKGDEISNNAEIATVSNTKKMRVELPFNAQQVKSISVGSTAVLSSSVHMSSVNGKVTHVSNSGIAQEDGSLLHTVVVEFTNPGSFTNGVQLGAEINGMISPGGGTAQYYNESKAKAETEGTVVSVRRSNGDYVSKGDVILTLSNDDVENNYKKAQLDYSDAQLALQEQQEKLEDYTVTAPISGTVVTKNSKVGDTIDKTNSSVTMMVIADVSKLKFSLEIDELDIAKVNVGQEVAITCDAVEGKTFRGAITELAMEGTATNGVTTYQAVVTIDDPGELKPSMNIDAVVIIESAENVLRVPTTDVITAMGKSYVFVKGDGKNRPTPEATQSTEQRPDGAMRGERPEGMPEGAMRGERPEGMPEGMMRGERPEEMPEGAMGSERPEGIPNAEMPDGASQDGMNKSASDDKAQEASGEGPKEENKNAQQNKLPEGRDGARAPRMPEAPEGFTTVEVVIGVQGDDFTEIKSGLSEGEEIYQQEVSSTNSNMMMPGMMGGMPGGGMPGGGGPRQGGGGQRPGGMR